MELLDRSCHTYTEITYNSDQNSLEMEFSTGDYFVTENAVSNSF